jgi:hypothetical protein
MLRALAIFSASALLLGGCATESKDSPPRPHDAKVAGTPYHATALVPCSMGGGMPTNQCEAGVVRQGGGFGTVTVTKPDGRTRNIFFENGRATGYDMSQADSGRMTVSRQADLNIIRIGQERYEIPDAMILGG